MFAPVAIFLIVQSLFPQVFSFPSFFHIFCCGWMTYFALCFDCIFSFMCESIVDPALHFPQDFDIAVYIYTRIFPDNSVSKEYLQHRRPLFYSWVQKICWRRDRLPTPAFLASIVPQLVKKSTCNVGDLGSISGLGRSPGKGKGYPLQYSGLGNSMNYTLGVAKSETRLNDFHFHIQTRLF